MKKVKLSAEAKEVLFKLKEIENKAKNRTLANNESIELVNYLPADEYDKCLNGICELAYHKFIVAYGAKIDSKYFFKKLRITRRGNKYINHKLYDATHYVTEIKLPKATEEQGAFLDRTHYIELVEKIVSVVVAVISCILAVYSTLK